MQGALSRDRPISSGHMRVEKKPSWKKYFHIQHLLVSAMYETDMESGNCCHESEFAAQYVTLEENHASQEVREVMYV